MSVTRRPIWIALALVAYCAWQSADIVGAWRDDPRNKFGWIALLIWLSPLASSRIRLGSTESYATENSILLWSGLAMSFLGTVGSLNALRFAGLACVLVGLSKWTWLRVPWLLASVCWMPLFGYVLIKGYSNSIVLPSRLLVAGLAAGWTFFLSRNRNASKS